MSFPECPWLGLLVTTLSISNIVDQKLKIKKIVFFGKIQQNKKQRNNIARTNVTSTVKSVNRS